MRECGGTRPPSADQGQAVRLLKCCQGSGLVTGRMGCWCRARACTACQARQSLHARVGWLCVAQRGRAAQGQGMEGALDANGMLRMPSDPRRTPSGSSGSALMRNGSGSPRGSAPGSGPDFMMRSVMSLPDTLRMRSQARAPARSPRTRGELRAGSVAFWQCIQLQASAPVWGCGMVQVEPVRREWLYGV